MKQESQLRVEGVDCPEEVKLIEKAVKPLTGVSSVSVNIMTGKALIQHDETIQVDDLIAAIAKMGLRSAIDTGQQETKKLDNKQLLCVCISGLFTLIGLIIQCSGLHSLPFSIASFGIAIIAGGILVFPKSLRAISKRSLDMNVLMTIAVIGAIGINQWAEGAAVMFLFSLSEFLESMSVARARHAVQSLLNIAPKIAWVMRDGDAVEIGVDEVKSGETVLVRSGMQIPLDGEVITGKSTVNQASITGESMPVSKKTGDPVFAGTLNGEGSLEIKVTKTSGDTMLAQIIRRVEEAQKQKAPTQRFVDVFAKYYTPFVILLALLVFTIPTLILGADDWQNWFLRALVLLVVACPCALVISTPISIVSGLTMMARRGVLIKGGAFLEAIAKLKVLAMDKTGTITEGKPQVREMIALKSTPAEDIIRFAAGVDVHSSHPLAEAIVKHAKQENITFERAQDYQTHDGRGAEGIIAGHHYFVGNHRFTHELGVCSEEIEARLSEIEEKGNSVVVVGHMPHGNCEGEVLGILAVGDEVRKNAQGAIDSLHKAGLKSVMLSGDNQRTANAIAQKVGIDEAMGDLLPDDKARQIKQLRKTFQEVGMIGDGVNDAPAMATASVSIAMGVAGSDTAIETADIALMKDDLEKVADTIKLGRRTLAIIRFNIAFSLVIKAIFLVLAVTGLADLWMAIAADTGATLLVIMNSLRLLQQQEKRETNTKKCCGGSSPTC